MIDDQRVSVTNLVQVDWSIAKTQGSCSHLTWSKAWYHLAKYGEPCEPSFLSSTSLPCPEDNIGQCFSAPNMNVEASLAAFKSFQISMTESQ